MGPGPTYALGTFLTGMLCLLGWLYMMANDPRSTALLKKSLWIILVPMILNPAPLFWMPIGMWLGAAFEEGIKAFASKGEQDRTNKFWLVSLFGVWELMIGKPFWGLVIAHSGEDWDRLSLVGLTLATMIPVLMHAVTAAIYAFWLDCKLWAAFALNLVIHAAYNESVNLYGLSLPAQFVQTVCLAALLAALLTKWPAASANTP